MSRLLAWFCRFKVGHQISLLTLKTFSRCDTPNPSGTDMATKLRLSHLQLWAHIENKKKSLLSLKNQIMDVLLLLSNLKGIHWKISRC